MAMKSRLDDLLERARSAERFELSTAMDRPCLRTTSNGLTTTSFLDPLELRLLREGLGLATDASTEPVLELCWFMFSFDEHNLLGRFGEDDAPPDEVDKLLVRAAKKRTWEVQQRLQATEVTPGALETGHIFIIDPKLDSLDALAAAVGDAVPAEAVALALSKARSLVSAEGWKFVAGRALIFEGNHNDTQLHLILSRPFRPSP